MSESRTDPMEAAMNDRVEESNGAPESVEFRAVFPPILSAASFGGDGARLKLDISEQDIAAAHTLVAFGRDKVMKVTVEFEENGA